MRWFKHDSNANRDAKLEKVLMRYGAEGYALYWLCLELIAEPIDKHNITFELEHDDEVLAYRLKMDSTRVEEIMRYMVGLELFEIDQTTQRVTCLKLANRLENSIVKNPQLKEIQQLINTESGTIRDNPGQSGKSPARLDQTRLDIKNTTSKPSVSPCAHEDVINLYHEILPGLQKVLVSRWRGSARAKNLETRWKEDEQHRDMDFWRWFFTIVKTNPHWMGENERGWKADLGWLLERRNFDKVIERGVSDAK